ncbi:methylated-DNA--[protein]-cysteine S-methyltransferase [Phenylobacterium sp.]|jgi:methylated-DNA-[protein]-cysteine S-methyltransferase|uniref:methylated-DNA--[protein]-cysteine S-methyltransferase n=1 Tax=Phenylobacterium sp. TaxID=1871053 RepID=UPI002E30B12F|nr:methylated-DNA--[protein]-cysteine S-methyltransferase [Phenylobacterium sp.]HEX4711831.1 methylated-DNA--[protein]-cysteine S-methyltransferase [Phenylobacterium sp.]
MPTINAPPEALTLDRLATPIGTALLVADEQAVLRAFNWTDYEPAMMAWIGRHYPKAKLVEGRAPPAMRGPFEAYFQGDPRALEAVRWRASGTAFQLEVWEALCSIPAGETLSYAGLAERIGRPTAVRAVGLANGANPVAVVVPCHRVIGTNGSLTGYGGGLPRKRWLLDHEGASFKDRLAA